jgi:hypothetical protein
MTNDNLAGLNGEENSGLSILLAGEWQVNQETGARGKELASLMFNGHGQARARFEGARQEFRAGRQ